MLHRTSELILAELRIAERFRNRADIPQLPYTMGLQRFEKLLDGQRRVSDGEDRQGFTTARRNASIADNSASL